MHIMIYKRAPPQLANQTGVESIIAQERIWRASPDHTSCRFIACGFLRRCIYAARQTREAQRRIYVVKLHITEQQKEHAHSVRVYIYTYMYMFIYMCIYIYIRCIFNNYIYIFIFIFIYSYLLIQALRTLTRHLLDSRGVSSEGHSHLQPLGTEAPF